MRIDPIIQISDCSKVIYILDCRSIAFFIYRYSAQQPLRIQPLTRKHQIDITQKRFLVPNVSTSKVKDVLSWANKPESKTIVKVIERFKNATYLELTLITGRTHQIRVHLAYKKHPVFNDTLYGAGQSKVKTEEQVLQSYYLRFTKPFGDEIIELEIEPDEKITKVLKYLKGL